MKSLPYAWALTTRMPHLFPAEPEQMPPQPADHRTRQQVERPDEQAVVHRALPTPMQPRFHREPFWNDADPAKPSEQPTEFPDTELAQRRGILVLEADLHQLREPIEPR